MGKIKMRKRYLKLLKSLVWPLIIIFFYFGYRQEINEVVKQLPDLIKNSKKVSFGGLSVEIKDYAIKEGKPELGEKIQGLSSNGIKTLLNLGSTNSIKRITVKSLNKSLYLVNDLGSCYELEKSGLLYTERYGRKDGTLNNFLEKYQNSKLTKITNFSKTLNIDGFDKEKLQMKLEKDSISKSEWDYFSNISVGLTNEGKESFQILLNVILKNIADN